VLWVRAALAAVCVLRPEQSVARAIRLFLFAIYYR
jgi:hypothetical protein